MSANKSRAEGQNQTRNDTNQNKEITASVNSIQTYFSLLPTLSVNIKNILGENCQVRVMTDSGSESTFISEKCLKLLGIKRKNARFQIKGLQDSKIAMTKGCVEIDLVSLHNPKVKLPVKAYVLEKLTAPLPTEKINEAHFSYLKNACLADPKFFIPNNIDMILGSDYFFSILLPGQITCSQSNLIAQNSIFGFLISGKLTDSLNSNSMLNFHINGTNIDNQLKQFWELEEIPNVKNKILTSEEQFVETHFQNTYACNSDGRFVVKLPFYKSNSELGDSKPAAISRLLAMERKFKNNPDFEKLYKEFMNEYESLGHMSLVNSSSHTSKYLNFLPHHAVIKPSSTTAKCFITPSSPHFGGIWESGIRSVKFNLKRVLGETILTFEELTTLLTQSEGLLNSRPLSYVNDSDIECISTLTPSHFLTGDVLLSVPEELPSSSNHRNRWELLQNIKRGFWKQWSADYLSFLQPRKKWQDAQPNLKEDDIVLIKEEGPPGTW
ncbi:DUF1758 domain-containing protein [Trichonephila clavipes]|nr:DUF1758 domain-containing protein [Trichonephila clavipes]